MEGIDYEYTTTVPEVSHGYLLPIIAPMIQDLPEHSTVLDMSCGNGSFIAMLRYFCWRLIGVDPSPSEISMAQASYPGVEFILADAQTDLLREIGLVDAILSTEVIEHLYLPKLFFKNA